MKEGTPHDSESSRNRERHAIILGAPFKPFERVRRWYDERRDKLYYDVPESHEHYLYLRRHVSLYGIRGAVDIISDDPMVFIEIMAQIARGYRTFSGHPLGDVFSTSIYKGNGNYEHTSIPAILRFSFLPTTPSEYAKLLCSYADIELGKDKFLTIFNLNQNAAKRKMNALEQGEKVLVKEKNLFNYDDLDKRPKITSAEGEVELNRKEDDDEDPGRISFVSFPIDRKKFRTVKLTFNRIYKGGEGEYPTIPILPDHQPLPVLAR